MYCHVFNQDKTHEHFVSAVGHYAIGCFGVYVHALAFHPLLSEMTFRSPLDGNVLIESVLISSSPVVHLCIQMNGWAHSSYLSMHIHVRNLVCTGTNPANEV